jgi:hypothetical protein
MAGGRVKRVGKAGDAEGEGPDEEGMCLDIPEVSASMIIETSAEIGGPGERGRKTGAVARL